MEYLIAKRKEHQRAEAYKTYVSDSLMLLATQFVQFRGGTIDMPRYYDIVHPANDHETRTPDEIKESIKNRINGGKK